MKNVILLIFFVCPFLQLKAQSLSPKDVPLPVMNRFSSANPTVKDVDWSKQGNNYKAEFDTNKVETAITYDVKGRIIETEIGISKTSLPAAAIDYLKNNYKDKLYETSKITSGKGIIYYEADLDSMGLVFNRNGAFVKAIKVVKRKDVEK